MKRKIYILQFICYSPRIYSGFDRFNIKLSALLTQSEYQSVFVFSDSINLPELINDINSSNIKIELLSTKNRLSITFGILKIFIKYRPAIVHSHFVNYIQLVTAFFSWFFFSKYFTTFHSTISLLSTNQYKTQKGAAKLFLLRFFYQFLILTSKKIFCVSKAIESQFKNYSGSKSKKIQCLYLGVEIGKVYIKEEIRQRLNLPIDNILICNLSAIEPIKGIDILIKAIHILKAEYNLLNFKVIHIGGLRSEAQENLDYKYTLENRVIELGLNAEFIWLGQRNDITEILSAFDIYVHPSRMEGIGVALMEAAAASMPLIGSNVGGIPEVIEHGVNGLLHEPEDSQKLAIHIKSLIENKVLRIEMGEESLRIVTEKFNLKSQTGLLQQHYIHSRI